MKGKTRVDDLWRLYKYLNQTVHLKMFPNLITIRYLHDIFNRWRCSHVEVI